MENRKAMVVARVVVEKRSYGLNHSRRVWIIVSGKGKAPVAVLLTLFYWWGELQLSGQRQKCSERGVRPSLFAREHDVFGHLFYHGLDDSIL